MNFLGFGILTWVKVGLVVAAILLVLGWKHGYDESRRDEGRAEIQAKWDEDKAVRNKALADMKASWEVERERADDKTRQLDEARNARANERRQRARTLPPAVSSVRVPAPAVVVLRDAIRDSTIVTGASGEPEKAAPSNTPVADSTVGLLTQWAVDVLAVCTEYRDRVLAWSEFYSRLRAAQPEESK